MGKRIEWTPRRRQNLARLIAEGLTYREIGRRMRISREAVKGAATYYGLMRPERRQGGRPWTRDEYDVLERMIQAGHTYREIGERLEREVSAIRHATARIGLSHPERQRRRRNPAWPVMEPIIQDCVEIQRMCIPQLEQHLTALGYQVTGDAVRYHLRTHHPRLYATVVENAAARRRRFAELRSRRAQARKRQQQEAA